MKKILTICSALALTASLNASILLSGDAVTGFTGGVDDGKIGVFLVSTDGSPLPTLLNAGLDLNLSATYGPSFAYINQNTVFTFFGTNLASGGEVVYGGGVDQGDSFGILLFESSTASTLPGDTYRIYTDASWVLPADSGAALNFGVDFAQLSAGGNSGVGSVVVPEPSTYAMLAGALALVAVMIRRRR